MNLVGDDRLLVDALPYIDQGYDDNARSSALVMIEDECRRYRPTKNYLEFLGDPDFDSYESTLMRNEFDRLQRRESIELLDMKRYELPGPSAGQHTDIGAWTKAVGNSEAQLEHQAIRIENLELMQDYGVEAWKSYNTVLQRMIDAAQKQLVSIRKSLQDVNYERKQKQTHAGDQLKSLESNWVGLVTKNYEIERAVTELENQIKAYNVEISVK